MNLKNIFILLFSFYNTFCQSQNLVSSSSFESEKTIDCLGCHNYKKFSYLIKGWKNSGFSAIVYSKDYVYTPMDIDHGMTKNIPQVYDGKNMVRLSIGVNNKYGSTIGTGAGSYLETKLKKPLKKENYYSVRLFVNVQDRKQTYNHNKFPILKHIGIAFSDKEFILSNPSEDLIKSDTPFLIDTIVQSEWIEMKHILYATKDLDYLAIGWFQNPYQPQHMPSVKGTNWFYYFVDNVEVEKIEQPDSLQKQNAIHYPILNPIRYKKVLNSPSDSLNIIKKKKNKIYFDFASTTINPKELKKLDTLIYQLKKYKDLVFYIEGHADSIGNNNLEFSRKRAFEVKKYLVEKGKIASYRFITKSKGDIESIATNQTKIGRQKNRRVEIFAAEITSSQKIYQLATSYAKNNQIDSSFLYLRNWLKLKNTDKVLLLFDPELKVLHSKKEWKAVEFFVKDYYKKYKRSELAYQLDYLYCQDQFYRSLGNDFEYAKGYMPQTFKLSFEEATEKMDSLDKIIYPKIIEMIEMEGFIDAREVGERASSVLMYGILHSNIITMEKYLPIFEKLFKENRIEGVWYARLYDRIFTIKKGMQRYGTQFEPTPSDSKEYRLVPLEEPNKVDSLRSSIGLPLLVFKSFRIKEN